MSFVTPASPPRAAKPHLTVKQQVQLMVSRKLHVPDVAAAEAYLLRDNYYRLSGYAREFQIDPSNGNNDYKPGTSFSDLAAAMERDDWVRSRVLPALLAAERLIRGPLAYHLAQLHGSGAFYLSPQAYKANLARAEGIPANWTTQLLDSKHPTVRHYISGTDCSHVPIWVAIEHASFGTVAMLFECLADDAAANAVADTLGFKRVQFPSVINSLRYLRNSCAHHAQLWHRYNRVPCPYTGKNTHRRHLPKWSPNSVYTTLHALNAMLQGHAPAAHAHEELAEVLEYLASSCPLVPGYLEPSPQRSR